MSLLRSRPLIYCASSFKTPTSRSLIYSIYEISVVAMHQLTTINCITITMKLINAAPLWLSASGVEPMANFSKVDPFNSCFMSVVLKEISYLKAVYCYFCLLKLVPFLWIFNISFICRLHSVLVYLGIIIEPNGNINNRLVSLHANEQKCNFNQKCRSETNETQKFSTGVECTKQTGRRYDGGDGDDDDAVTSFWNLFLFSNPFSSLLLVLMLCYHYLQRSHLLRLDETISPTYLPT